MTEEDAFDMIRMVYEHSDYRECEKQPSISATTLIGPLYKGKLALEGREKDESLIDLVYKRSSTLGTAFHQYAEKVLNKYRPEIITERYMERDVDGITISGSCDILALDFNDKYTIMDWKTGYGKERKHSDLMKDRLQMSIYRWLNQDLETNDKAYTLFISQSNNAQKAYEIDLLDIDEVQTYIENRLFAIRENTKVDCKDGVSYNTCTYCSFVNCERRK